MLGGIRTTDGGTRASCQYALKANGDGRVAGQVGFTSHADVQEHRLRAAAGHLCTRVHGPQLRHGVLYLVPGIRQHDEVRRTGGGFIAAILPCGLQATQVGTASKSIDFACKPHTRCLESIGTLSNKCWQPTPRHD